MSARLSDSAGRRSSDHEHLHAGCSNRAARCKQFQGFVCFFLTRVFKSACPAFLQDWMNASAWIESGNTFLPECFAFRPACKAANEIGDALPVFTGWILAIN